RPNEGCLTDMASIVGCDQPNGVNRQHCSKREQCFLLVAPTRPLYSAGKILKQFLVRGRVGNRPSLDGTQVCPLSNQFLSACSDCGAIRAPRINERPSNI